MASALPLVGRRRELAWIGERLTRACESEGAIVTLVGQRGMGKTRLAASWRASSRPRWRRALPRRAGPSDAALDTIGRLGAARAPTLVVLDDADRGGIDVLAALGELRPAIDALPVLLLAITQNADALAGIDATDSLMLTPLDDSACVPRRVHDAASQWARREAGRRVGAAGCDCESGAAASGLRA